MKTIITGSRNDSSRVNSADDLRDWLTDHQVLLADFFASPGAGKTTLIRQLYPLMKPLHTGVIEADYDSSKAVNALFDTGYPTVRLMVPNQTHIDPQMVYEGVCGFDREDSEQMDVIFLENNGSLSRPMSLDTGAHAEILVLSVPEGEDRPLKFPASFQRADLIVVSKVDVLDHFDFDMNRFQAAVRVLNPNVRIIPYSSKTKEGLDEIAAWISQRQKALQ